MRNILALAIIVSMASVGISACSDDNNNDVGCGSNGGHGSNVVANPNNDSTSDSFNDIFNGQSQEQDQDQDQEQDQEQTVSS